MAVVIADLRQHLEGQLTAKKHALTETEENLRKYVGERAVDGQGGRPGRGRGGAFVGGRGLARGRSLADRLGSQNDGDRGGMGERGGVVDRAAGGDTEEVVNKSVMSRVVKEVKSREETLEEQKSDKKVVDRNRRMFGALVGTLQRFNKEEIKKKDVLEKKKVVEKKVEEKNEREKEEIKNRKKELFDEQKKKKKDIQIIQIQMKRVEEYEAWEKSKKSEVNFIRTKTAQPDIYWLPKHHTEQSEALLVESRDMIEKEIEERKEKFEAELVAIEKKMMADMERRRSGGRSDVGERLDQSGDLDESIETKQEDDEEGEDGFMADRRVVEREVDQDGERNGGDLRMTLKNDHVSERVVRRKEDTEEKKEEKEERRIVVKDEKEIEERKVRRDQDRQREEERRIRKEEEKRRDNKRRSERSEEVKGRSERERNDDYVEKKQDRKVSDVPHEKNEEKHKKVEESGDRIDKPVKPSGNERASMGKEKSVKDDTKLEAVKELQSRKGGKGRDSSSDSEEERKEKRIPPRKRQRSGRSYKKDEKIRRRGDSSDSSSEEERRPRKRRSSSSSSSDSEDEKRRKDQKNRRGAAKQLDRKRAKSSSSEEGRKKVRKNSKHESSSEDSSSDSD